MEDFIRIWTNKVPENLCTRAIQTFEQIIQDPAYKDSIIDNAKQFSDSNIGRKDLAIFLGDAKYNQSDLCNEIMDYLHSCLLEYIEEFGQLKALTLSNRYAVKLQRTLPTGGYHVWHCENGNPPENYCRELVWMIYLNDMPDGEAETEFLYQRRRVKPSRGTVVFWPAGSTHIHRGNPVYTGAKYILTGWYHKE
jgi:hypothetical protein